MTTKRTVTLTITDNDNGSIDVSFVTSPMPENPEEPLTNAEHFGGLISSFARQILQMAGEKIEMGPVGKSKGDLN